MKYALYYHSGCANHGCEAIVRSTGSLIKEKDATSKVKLFTFYLKEDKAVGLTEFDEIEEYKFNEGRSSEILGADRIKLAVLSKLSQTKADEYYYSFSCKNPSLNENDVYLSVGGDNYCYGDISPAVSLNKALKKLDKKTVLWGCSIGEEDLTEQKIKDLRTYDLITARESITYENLKKAGLEKKLKLCADPAFILKAEYLPLPDGFDSKKTIGVNISPLIMKLEANGHEGIVLRSMQKLIDYIIENTDNQIAFIPHVASPHSNDYIPLSQLHEMYKNTGRTVLLPQYLNAMQIKGYIARCRAFVGARTHATIDAYSANVPTLVLGYSVKAKGIARDIFGSEENLVLSIKNLKDDDELTGSFLNILENEDKYRQKLQEVMPEYINRARSAVDYLFEL